MEVTFKLIICKYDNPLPDGYTGYTIYWNEPEHGHTIDVSKHSIKFLFNSETPSIDYYENGTCKNVDRPTATWGNYLIKKKK